MKKSILLSIALMFTIVVSKAQTNYLDNYIGSTPAMTVIATSSNQVSQPRDLDFRPGTNELWVCQYGNTSGGTMNIFFDAGMPSQTNQLRQDDHSDHFFYYPSAIAFGDNGQFGAVSEIQNTSSSAATFMGPSLWTADTAIFARVWQNNWANNYPLGSHLDMLHQSPYSMGIAHDTLMAYWVMDGYNGNICKYDFVQDHGPGYDNHSAGKIWRYSDVTVTRVPQVPSHLVLDKPNGWLYFMDGGSKRVKRMNVNSATFAGNLTVPSTANEPLAGYYNYTGATIEVIDSFSTQPCGMDYYNGRLIVSDYTTGNIYLYNTTGALVTLMDTIVTGHPGIMGIKVGPNGHIWCVNKTENKIYRLDVVLPLLDAAITKIVSPDISPAFPNFYSTDFDLCSNSITPTINVKNTGSDTIASMEIHFDLDGGVHTVYNWSGSLISGNTVSIALPSATVPNGTHQLETMIMMVNGMTDDIEGNNILKGSFRAFSPVQSLPYSEDFSTTNFPPSNCQYVYFNINNMMSRATQSANGIGSGSLKMNNYSGPMIIAGQKDYFMLPLLDFSSTPSNTYLNFDVAHAQYSSSDNDELKVVASTDCGATWSTLYGKMGSSLSTAPLTTSAFTPSSSQWRNDTASLSNLIGQSEVMLMFTTISDYGNNLYIDNIKIQTINVGVNEVNAKEGFNIYPNPANDFINIQFAKASDAKISVANVLGEEIFSKQISSSQNIVQLKTVDWTKGIYFLTINDGVLIHTKKVLVQ